MALRLSIVGRHGSKLGTQGVKEFGPDGGTIGRSVDCNWVLPDTKRYLSSRHASIDFRSGSYYIVDTSTNGVYVNEAEQPVGRGKPQRLFGGDRIRIGEYVMSVEIDDDPIAPLIDENHVDPVDIAQRVEAPDPTGNDLVDAYEITGVGIEMMLTDDELETLTPPVKSRGAYFEIVDDDRDTRQPAAHRSKQGGADGVPPDTVRVLATRKKAKVAPGAPASASPAASGAATVGSSLSTAPTTGAPLATAAAPLAAAVSTSPTAAALPAHSPAAIPARTAAAMPAQTAAAMPVQTTAAMPARPAEAIPAKAAAAMPAKTAAAMPAKTAPVVTATASPPLHASAAPSADAAAYASPSAQAAAETSATVAATPARADARAAGGPKTRRTKPTTAQAALATTSLTSPATSAGVPATNADAAAATKADAAPATGASAPTAKRTPAVTAAGGPAAQPAGQVPATKQKATPASPLKQKAAPAPASREATTLPAPARQGATNSPAPVAASRNAARPSLPPTVAEPAASAANTAAAAAAGAAGASAGAQPIAPIPSGAQNVDAFFSGAGLSIRLPPQHIDAFLFRLGQVVNAMLVGITENLHVRAEQKNALRLEGTTIQPQDNNPLKLSAGIEETFANLLLRDSDAHLPAPEAVREAFEDVKLHQQVLLKAVRAALEAFVARLDPEELEHKLARGRNNVLVNAANRLKYWDFYRDLYDVVAHHPPGELPAQFLEDFGQAYERELEQALGGTPAAAEHRQTG